MTNKPAPTHRFGAFLTGVGVSFILCTLAYTIIIKTYHRQVIYVEKAVDNSYCLLDKEEQVNVLKLMDTGLLEKHLPREIPPKPPKKPENLSSNIASAPSGVWRYDNLNQLLER